VCTAFLRVQPQAWRTVLSSNKPLSKPPSNLPASSERKAFDAKEIGLTLTIDQKTLEEIEQINEETIQAAQAIRKFAWR